MSDEEFAEMLKYFMDDFIQLDSYGDDESDGENNYPELKDAKTKTFNDVGMLTMNAGLVITLSNGDEYQLTVVQSR
jgi:hypothetical protein